MKARRFQIVAPWFLVGRGGPTKCCLQSKVEQMEAELRKLSQAELGQIRDWRDDLIEDELKFTRNSKSRHRL